MTASRYLDQLHNDLAKIDAEAFALDAEIDALDVEYPTRAQVARLDQAITRRDELDARAAQLRRDIEDIEEGVGLRKYLGDCATYRSAAR